MRTVIYKEGFASTARGGTKKSSAKYHGGNIPQRWGKPYRQRSAKGSLMKEVVARKLPNGDIVVAFPYSGYAKTKDICNGFTLTSKGVRLNQKVSLSTFRKVGQKSLMSELDWAFLCGIVNLGNNSYRCLMTTRGAWEKPMNVSRETSGKKTKKPKALKNPWGKNRKKVSLSEGLDIIMGLVEKKENTPIY